MYIIIVEQTHLLSCECLICHFVCTQRSSNLGTYVQHVKPLCLAAHTTSVAQMAVLPAERLLKGVDTMLPTANTGMSQVVKDVKQGVSNDCIYNNRDHCLRLCMILKAQQALGTTTDTP